MSPQVQNEIIDICGKVILDHIVLNAKRRGEKHPLTAFWLMKPVI